MGGQSAKLKSSANGINNTAAVVKPHRGRYIFQRLTSDFGVPKTAGPSVVVTPPDVDSGKPTAKLVEKLQKNESVKKAARPSQEKLQTIAEVNTPKPVEKNEMKLTLKLTPSESFSGYKEFVTARERLDSDPDEIKAAGGESTVRSPQKIAQTPRAKLLSESLSIEKQKKPDVVKKQSRLSSTAAGRAPSKRSQEVGVPPKLRTQNYATNSEKIRMFFDQTPEKRPIASRIPNGNAQLNETEEVGVYLLSPSLMFSPRDVGLETTPATTDNNMMITPRLGPTDSECNSASTSKNSSDYIDSPLVTAFNRSQTAHRNTFRVEGRNEQRKARVTSLRNNNDFDQRMMARASYNRSHEEYPYHLEYRRNHVNAAYNQQQQQQQQYYYDPYLNETYGPLVYHNGNRSGQYQFRPNRERIAERSAYESLPFRRSNRHDSAMPHYRAE